MFAGHAGADPAAVAVMMEDGAAVAGLLIAGGCLALCQVRARCVERAVRARNCTPRVCCALADAR
jgi:hypothetical protein